jgi:hypothetical protein
VVLGFLTDRAIGGKGEDVFAACDIDDPNLLHCREEWVFLDYNIANWNAISVFREF